MKSYLKKVIGESTLTFEEFSTVLSRIEACLNSRPIKPISSNPTDLESLTSGHFLIGRPLLHPLEPSTLDKKPHNRWKLVSQMIETFWKRWSSQEYLHTLQQRTKWKIEHENLKIGEIVIIKEDNLPPQRWLLGRITQIYPGKDNKIRVATVRLKEGEKLRVIVKLIKLPIVQENDPDISHDTLRRQ
jgi:hypothetical protein